MEQFIFLLVLGAIALVKWLLEKSAELREQKKTEERLDRLERQQPPASPMHAPRPTAFPVPDLADAERRLREALGLPDESALPPRRQPAPVPQPEPLLQMEEVKPLPLADLEQRTVEPPPVLPKKRVPFRAPPAKVEDPVPAVRAGLQDLLRTRDGLRKAVIAQEILGTPKGLVF